MFGYRSVPPATNIPSGPASPFIVSASLSVEGWRYRNDGSLSMYLLDGPAVASLPRCGHSRRLGPGNGGEARRSEPAFVPLRLGPQCLEHLLRSDGHLVHADPNGVIDGISHRRHHRQQRPLADLLRTEGILWTTLRSPR